MNELEKQALDTANEIAEELSRDGAEAIILTGSWARSDAHPQSDLDIRVIGDGDSKKLIRREPFLASIAWMTQEEHEEGFKDPAEVGSVVPGWRSAEILYDPESKAAKLKERAEAWDWAEIEDDIVSWVGNQIAKQAEEVHTLFTNHDLGLRSAAAAQCAMVALELAPILAVHHRILYETEKELWDLVCKEMPDEWKAAQETALGEHGGSLAVTSAAAFRLFLIASDTVADVLDADQAAVVKHSRSLAEEGIAKLETGR